MKFTVNGQIKIVAAYDETNELLKIQVVDTGQGIKERELDKLLKMFSKLELTEELN